MRYVAAFRTYTWDDGVAELARRFFAAFPAARQVVFANEAKGKLPIADYEVVSHGDDTTSIRLPEYPAGNAHWYNVDYALYILRDTLPDYDYYVVSESDLAVNLTLEPLLDAMKSQELGMVVHDLLPSAEPWHWHANATASFRDPWRALCFFMAASGETIDDLYRIRLEHAREFAEGTRAQWPFCETFVPSTLKMLGIKVGQIGDHAETTNLRFRPKLALGDPRANRAGSMAHSVVSDEKLYASLLREDDPKDWFSAESHLSQSLIGHDLLRYGHLFLEKMKSRHEHPAFQELRRRMIQAGAQFSPEQDIAYCKPAITSSTSAWSTYPDAQRDACCANGEFYYDDCAFHTDMETSPWWMVDLLETFLVNRVAIVNRVNHADRFRQFEVESSVSGTAWTSRFIKLDFGDVSSDRDHPYDVSFPEPIAARFLRVRRLGKGVLHLRRIAIYGRPPVDGLG